MSCAFLSFRFTGYTCGASAGTRLDERRGAARASCGQQYSNPLDEFCLRGVGVELLFELIKDAEQEVAILHARE
jgi:hypothetical protein